MFISVSVDGEKQASFLVVVPSRTSFFLLQLFFKKWQKLISHFCDRHRCFCFVFKQWAAMELFYHFYVVVSGMEKNVEEALVYWKRAADLGESNACLECVKSYFCGKPNVFCCHKIFSTKHNDYIFYSDTWNLQPNVPHVNCSPHQNLKEFLEHHILVIF